MRIDGWLGCIVWLLRNDHRDLATETVLQSLQQVFAVVVVLIENADLLTRMVLENIFGVDITLNLIRGSPPHGPGKILWIVPFGRAGRYKELGNLHRVHVFVDGRIRWRSERTENQQHL